MKTLSELLQTLSVFLNRERKFKIKVDEKKYLEPTKHEIKVKEYDNEIVDIGQIVGKKTSPNKVQAVKNQYIFQLTPINKKKWDKFKEEDPLFIFKPQSQQKLSIKNQCSCNPNLKLIEGEKDIYKELKTFINPNSNHKQLIEIDGYYYQIDGAQPNVLISNPDTDDPPPPKPNNSNAERETFRDEYIPLRESFLKKAFYHNQNLPESPVVAIMDSGIDLRYFDNEPEYIKGLPLNFYQNQCGLHSNDCNLCDKKLRNHSYGWSFIDEDVYKTYPNNPYDDDGRHKHGTRIAKIIADRTDNNVRLMPLKTADYQGVHQFFDIYCAFEYILKYNDNAAEKDKVRIINASWGYYGAYLPLFGGYIEKLNTQGVLLITSAGNDDLEIGAEHPYYPAMFSKKNRDNKVYTITTVAKAEKDIYKVKENYSAEYVDAGVVGTEQGRFDDPLREGIQRDNRLMIKGSSYAVAYYTGFLAEQLGRGIGVDRLEEQEFTAQVNGIRPSDIVERGPGSPEGLIILGNKASEKES